MKKALSLFLVFVMVALMIPFSAFVTSAAGETKATTNAYVTNGSTYWAWDFTKMTSVNDLPTGWTFGQNTGFYVDKGLVFKVDPKGGTAVSGDAVNLTDTSNIEGFDLFNSNGDFTVSVKWFTDTKTAHLGVTVAPAADPRPTYRFKINGGPSAKGIDVSASNVGTSGKLVYHNNKDAYSKITDDTGNEITYDQVPAILTEGAKLGAMFTYSLEFKGGQLKRLHVSSLGRTVTYDLASTSYTLAGLGLNNSGTWSGTTATLVSVAVEKGAYDGPVEVQSVAHNYNVANATSIDTVPYDTYSVDGYANVALKNGALWHTVKKSNDLSYNSMIKIDEEYFVDKSNYTLDFTLAGGSAARIFFVAFGLNDDINSLANTDKPNIGYNFLDGRAFKLRMADTGEETSMWKSDNCNIWVYDDAGFLKAASTTSANHLPDNMVDALKAGKSDISVRVVVECNALRCAYITVDGITVKATPKSGISAPVGDVAFLQQSTKSFGLKSVTIYDRANYDQPVAVTEQIVTPAGKAVVKNGGEATVVDAGYVVENAIALKDNTGAIVPATAIAAGKVYAPITKADLEAKALTAGDAELRLASNPGIRFKTSFAAGDFDFIMSLIKAGAVKAVKMGTLVTVDTYLAEADAFTAEALAAYGASIEKNVYMDIVADATALYAENTFAGSVIGVKSLERNYVARAYVTLTLADGEITIYSDATEAVSVKELAQAIVEADYAGYDDADSKAALDYLANYAA